MIYCRQCGSQLNDNDQFCMDCGSPVAKVETGSADQPMDSINSRPKKDPDNKYKIAIGGLLAVIILTGGIWFGFLRQTGQTPTSSISIVEDTADTVKEKFDPLPVQSETMDTVGNSANGGRQALNPQSESSPVNGSFKNLSGSGYFIDPFSQNDDKCTFDINAKQTAVGVAVNLEFRDPLYYDTKPIKITADYIADGFDLKIIPGSTECQISVLGTYQIGTQNPVNTMIHFVATDADVDTLEISIPGTDWQEQELTGGSIVIDL